MAIRGVLKSDEPILREKCKEVTEFNERLWTLLEDMKETMLFEDGVGLAAPQIGILKRICVISMDGESFHELINPVITKEDGTQTCVEGCLSIVGINGKVVRPKNVVVKAQNRFGEGLEIEASDAFANVLCHEIDHLDGILFTDRMIAPMADISKLKGVRKSAKKQVKTDK